MGALFPPTLRAAQQAIAETGQYVVLALLIVECALFLADRRVSAVGQEERAVVHAMRTG